MIADILINIKVNQIVTELLARGKNVDIYSVLSDNLF